MVRQSAITQPGRLLPRRGYRTPQIPIHFKDIRTLHPHSQKPLRRPIIPQQITPMATECRFGNPPVHEEAGSSYRHFTHIFRLDSLITSLRHCGCYSFVVHVGELVRAQERNKQPTAQKGEKPKRSRGGGRVQLAEV